MNKLSSDDKQALKQAMNRVRPLKKRNTTHTEPLPKPKRLLHKKPLVKPEPEDTLLDNIGISSVSGIQTLFFSRTGLQQRVIRKLKRGLFDCDDELDLHGFYTDEARQTVQQFIQHAIDSHYKYLRIVHGKGSSEHPKIKNLINNWLQQFPEVLAFCSAQPKDGGTGAIYVLLKSS